ncbi:uncharacterized protein LOC122878816 isoform X1 [Siniperca chuatsi]|uniref:uncharacterized protein LOC122878816 isoform X1 n=1 Tax=Siniperca chuatsi TaxID=119488 RepID=UPI001CE1343F|nr:uncharacterized protein LOC122878816 isoform X1 [Siniperca chuatsi]XP_044058167.1 uncharacterized protein LOC122878816 isoform X1 [Siniperca chuatsi]
MSVELYSPSGPGGTNASLQGTTVGGSKPLHRFIRAQPKITGIIVLVLGSSLCIVSISITPSSFQHIRKVMLGALFIICGMMYILTEHHPTKKTVTISLALSIVTILGSFWTVLYTLPYLAHFHYRDYSDFLEYNVTDTEEVWSSYHEAMEMTVEMIFWVYAFVGAIIFIVMSVLAGAALRSTKSQAILEMTAMPTEPQQLNNEHKRNV